jgi:bifunctional N-acetylglucosamine-1-phosphate-uridyltransferase/glucosamine-1-phosphate-acetyltransferase GlmU-like protein
MSNQVADYQRIAPDVKLGRNVRIHGFVNLYGCEIGDETKIGTFVEIQKGVRIGDRCKICSHTFICEGVTIEPGVFVAHGVTFINDAILGRLIPQASSRRNWIGIARPPWLSEGRPLAPAPLCSAESPLEKMP